MKKHIFSLLVVISFLAMLVFFPQISRTGVSNGILLCGRVIIPSLFPFTMCVIFIMNTNILKYLNFISPITRKIFSLNANEFSIFILSLIGGYPVGAKLIDESVLNNNITPQKGKNMTLYCLNAGPAFIISAVGCGVFNSKVIGGILFLSHIIPSFLFCLIFRRKDYSTGTYHNKNIPFSDNFVISAAKASETLISICSFVLFFSVLNSYFLYFGEFFEPFKKIALLFEITNSLSLNKNIYTLSFILGFGGICVWFQTFAQLKHIKINYLEFVFCRVLHGSLSTFFTYILFKIFKITIPTVSTTLSYRGLYSTPSVTFSLFIMVIVFTISLSTQKYNCKISENVV